MKRVVSAAMLLAVAGSATLCAAGTAVLPKYEKWEKSKQKIITDKKSLFYGIHYIYADKKALSAYKTGGKYPEGSQFVVVQYSIKDEGKGPIEGKKSMIVLMRKDKKQAETGGWLFAGFNHDGKPSGLDPVKNCYECHLKEAKETGFIISKYADFK